MQAKPADKARPTELTTKIRALLDEITADPTDPIGYDNAEKLKLLMDELIESHDEMVNQHYC